MFSTKTHKTAAFLAIGIACLAAPCVAPAAGPIRLSGVISGVVSDSMGIPQMGAIVLLYNRQDRVYGKVQTDDLGQFKFLGLFPDLYSVKVTLATFVPALKKNILVQPGMRSVLNVNLNTLFSTIQLSYPSVESGSLMSDEWKWVLRTASSTRPVLRFAADPLAHKGATSMRSAMFSDTRGILRVSAGDGPLVTGIGNEADLGTAFALATSLYGANLLQVSGNVGYGSQTGVPTAAFRTSYSRDIAGGSPEVSLTMRQLFLPERLGAAAAGTDSALPMLRSMSAAFNDRSQLTEDVALQYGFTLDSVSFFDHLNYFSPYARLSYKAGNNAEVDFAYTSGNGRPDLAGAVSQDGDLQRDLGTLGLFPRISLLGARPKIQRGEEYELTYSLKARSRTYQVSAYRESVTNAALSLVAPAGMYSGGDILPDLFSGNSIFDAGDYHSVGYTAAVTQNLGEHLSATLMYGSMGALTAQDREIVSDNPDELRSMIRSGRKQAATTRVTATSPWTGTHMIASYQWTDSHRWAMPGHLYSTQPVAPLPGLNVYIRQPIPGFSMLPWRMEATADLRNMLAQGYLRLGMADGQSVLLVETPRSFRGGLSFIF
jgi:hypothetical protein